MYFDHPNRYKMTDQKAQVLQHCILSAAENTLGTQMTFSYDLLDTPEMQRIQIARNRVRKKLKNLFGQRNPARIKRLKAMLVRYNTRYKQLNRKQERINFESYLEKINESPTTVYYETCRLKNKAKRRKSFNKCDLEATKELWGPF